MKRVFPIFICLILFLSACDMPGAQPEPTAISLPTAAPTQNAAEPTAKSAAGKVGDERTSKVDGMMQVFVPAGFFQMGGLDPDGQVDEKPGHKVTLNAFWMDKVTVTNGMYDLCVKAGVCGLPRDFKSASRPSYFGNPEFNDYPVVYVTWEDAKNYCSWAGRRLPTEAEWEYAARGSADYRTYPWGNDVPNDTLANFNYAVKDTTRVGSYPAGASPFGVLDMAGNVWQWVFDYYGEKYYEKSDEMNPTGPTEPGVNGMRRSLRGGSWLDSVKDIRLANRGFALAPNLTADKSSQSYQGDAKDNIGFRCVSDN